MVEETIKLEKIDELILFLKPFAHTYIFELKQRWKKFVIFSIIISLIGLLNVIGYVVFPENSLPNSQVLYFEDELGLIILINIFSVCFFFGGIICNEFSQKSFQFLLSKTCFELNSWNLYSNKMDLS